MTSHCMPGLFKFCALAFDAQGGILLGWLSRKGGREKRVSSLSCTCTCTCICALASPGQLNFVGGASLRFASATKSGDAGRRSI
ncbi:hypothetical protein VFPPC_15612 [Pochonia chlamydosporia 170]|uniref:Uncharacterized protein n=1 Tax=Pochonia chlamydosporia 170 TaxID=1380566 RepID=A0A179FYM0_METCM|nr:hypothetical protein VFPPC_15612 [Pochonia chlamydosporia 170]OAQ70712.1 hypothetical protein VFPPC_15612 [Pochonia chlamydosporia 170]